MELINYMCDFEIDYSTVIALIAVIIATWSMLSRNKRNKISELTKNYYLVINDIYSFTNTIPSFQSQFQDTYEFELDKKKIIVKEKKSESGSAVLKQMAMNLINPINNPDDVIWTLEVQEGSTKVISFKYSDEKGKLKLLEKLYKQGSGCLNQFFIKVEMLLRLANSLSEYKKPNMLIRRFKSKSEFDYLAYAISSLTIYHKFIIAFVYINDKDFEYKSLIDEFHIIKKGAFDTIITKNDIELDNIYKSLKLK